MCRMPVIAALTLVWLFTSVPSVYAEDDHGWWGWLQEFSGPGSFTSNRPWKNRHVTFGCWWRTEQQYTSAQLKLPAPVPASRDAAAAQVPGSAFPFEQATLRLRERQHRFQLFGTPLHPNARAGTRADITACLFVDETRYKSTARRGFPEVTAEAVDVGAMIFLVGPFDLGGAVGFIHFDPDDARGFTKFTVTPFRLEARPLFFVDASSGRPRWLRRLANSPKFYVKATAIIGRLSAVDFGVRPDATPEAQAFFAGGDLVHSYGFVFDVGELLGLVER